MTRDPLLPISYKYLDTVGSYNACNICNTQRRLIVCGSPSTRPKLNFDLALAHTANLTLIWNYLIPADFPEYTVTSRSTCSFEDVSFDHYFPLIA